VNAVRRGSAADPARVLALRILVAFEEHPAPVGDAIDRAQRSLERVEDRGLVQNLVLQVIRHRARLDWVLEKVLSGGGLVELTPWIRNTLRLGLAQIVLLPRIPPHAAVDTSVELAKRFGHSGTAGLTNAVLRRLVKEARPFWDGARGVDRRATLALIHSAPRWLVERWCERWGEDAAARRLAWSSEPPGHWLRFAAAGPALERVLVDDSPEAKPREGTHRGWIPDTVRLDPRMDPTALPGFAERAFTIQDGSAILIGMLPPRVRGVVIDACAAPGTKTAHLAARAEEETTLVAVDSHWKRLRKVPGAFAPAEVAPSSVRPHLAAADARRLPFRTGLDGILIDAPCSNLGVLRRRPELRWRIDEASIRALAETQRELLDEAAGRVAAGGWLLYSVCTIEPEETTAQRDRFLAAHPEFTPIELPHLIPSGARAREGEMLLLPGDHETDGGYAFLVERGPSRTGAV